MLIPIIGNAQTSYTSTSATTAWNASRWNNTANGPTYTSAYTANNNVSFTSGTYSFAGMGAALNVGNVTVASGVTVNFASIGSTFATGGAVRTFDIGSGATFDFNGQALSTAAGTGFIKSGAGVLGTGGGAFTGGFTLNAGTVVARGTTGLGSGGTNTLTLNGGTVAANNSRDFANTRFPGGIVVGGNVQFGELATIVSIASSTANLSFANDVSLGTGTRTLTQGNNGSNTFSGVISNTSGGLTFAANSGTDGRFELTNASNTFTGDININGGEVRFTGDGSMGNAANDIIIDGGRFSKASDSATVTMGAGRALFVGDGAGTSISSPGSGTLIYNGVIANKSGETGSWAKQGGGTLQLGGVSTYTGSTAINNGTTRLTTGNDRLPTGTVLSLGQAASANLGTLDLNGFNQQIAGLNSTTGTSAAVNNNIVTSATTSTLTINTAAATTHSYGDGSNANSGIITGAISLVKSGDGTQVLGDTNTYTGTTTVSDGTLIINGDQSAANGAVTVASGATLGGTGTIGGNVVIDGGIHAPGNSPGIQTFAGDLTYNTGSTIAWELKTNTVLNAANPNAVFDTIVVGGDLNFAGTATLSLATILTAGGGTVDWVNSFWDTSKTGTNGWLVFDVTGTTTGFGNLGLSYAGLTDSTGASFATGRPGGSFSLFKDGDDVFLNYDLSAVPEPSTYAILALGLGGLLVWQRKRRRLCNDAQKA